MLSTNNIGNENFKRKLNMYTTKTASREKTLEAVAATLRAMERHACCKSQFKFKCFSCGEMINRGDKITRCMKATTGMTLRYRGAGGECGLSLDETAFYRAETGKNMWVHIGCQPCFWDEGLDEEGNRLTHPAIRPITTEWGAKLMMEWDEWMERPCGEAWLTMGYSYFRMINGYPEEKSMKDRIVQAVTRFQALWRGYFRKKAYQKLKRGQSQQARSRNRFLNNNSIGGHIEILFDERRTSAAIYSADIVNHTKRDLIASDDLYYWVTFHYDGEVRMYHWKKLLGLKLDCKAFKSKHGIMTKITGKLPLHIL